MSAAILIRSIDFETTGAPEEDKPQAICEAGWTDIHVNLADVRTGLMQVEVGEPNSMLVNPGRPMPHEARAVHHISDEDVAGCPSPDVACRTLGEGQVDYFCAHNADFEKAFFGGGGRPFICTYKVALRVWPDAESHSLQFLRYWLALDIDQSLGLPAHRAGPDAYVGAALMARILSEPDCPDFETMVRWSKGPALLPRINFGMHRGKKWEDVPASYLEWIIEKSDLDRDAKANAKHWLKQRRGE